KKLKQKGIICFWSEDIYNQPAIKTKLKAQSITTKDVDRIINSRI
ncbi:2614_t:CDS:1, partial [Funneliformis mosseae]